MATPTSLPATFVAGNVLTAAQMNDLRGAFRILQVVVATDGTSRTTTSTSYVDANISVTITPTSADSDVLLVWQASGKSSAGSTHEIGFMAITDASDVVQNQISFGNNNLDDAYAGAIVTAYLSPATTSATTYKGRFKADSSTVQLNGVGTGHLYAIEVSA